MTFNGMTISQYVQNINQRYKTGISREHAYRGDLQYLLETMLKNVMMTNEPAEKWLKDRRGRTLSMEEIQHYQKIIVALMETERVKGEIDGVFGGELR